MSRSLRGESHPKVLVCNMISLSLPASRNGTPTLPANLIQEIHDYIVLCNTHTIEVLAYILSQLFLALPSSLFVLLPSHGRRHATDRRSRKDDLIVWFIERCWRLQSIVIPVSVEYRRVEGVPLQLYMASLDWGSSRFEPPLTPGVVSANAVLEEPPLVPLGPAVTTSRSKLPAAVLPATRRPLPLRAVFVVVPTFSFVLEASDLESSGGGLDLGGAI